MYYVLEIDKNDNCMNPDPIIKTEHERHLGKPGQERSQPRNNQVL